MPKLSAGFVAACLLSCVHGMQNIEDFGAVAGNNSYGTAIGNGIAIAKAFSAAQNGSTTDTRTVYVPAGKTYSMLPAVEFTGLNNIIFIIDGNLSARTDNISLWPQSPRGGAMNMFMISTSMNFTITGSGNVLGNGYWWWWYVILTTVDDRPDLLRMFQCQNVLIEGVRWENSPQFHLYLEDMVNVTVRNMEVYVDVEGQSELLKRGGYLTDGTGDLPAGIPTFPLNTDGIDPAGRDIYISNVTITNFDDAVAVKPTGSGGLNNCTQNVTIDGARVKFGVGMTIGSVPPHTDVNCVRDVTFRNIEFETPIKAIYIKTNPGDTGSGIIDNILYENIFAQSPLWWSIYIGPQQQQQPGNAGTGCSFLYPLPNTTCPTQPRVPISNVTLRNVTMVDALLSAGLILCNASNPCTGINFESVNITTLSNWPVSGGYMCTNTHMNAINSYPVPVCTGAED